MVVVRRIVIGREGGGEEPAGAITDVVEEAALCAAVVPVGGDDDAAAVVEPEGGDVDGVGPGMFAPLAGGATVEAAAAVASERLNGRDPAAEPGQRRRLHEMPFPKGQRGGDTA